MKDVLLIISGLIMSVLISMATMIWGWGVEPKSWAIIIILGVFGQIFAQVIIQAGTRP